MTEQNRTEQNRTEQNRTEQNRTDYHDCLNFVKPLEGGPLVSIIVPVYNAEKYLVRCLDSLVYQTLREIEILCVNDGSTDGSSAILGEYAQKDPRIMVFHQENKGPGAARNTALDNVKGKYILFCDADDTLEPDAALECSAAMEKNGVDIVVFNANIIEVDRSVFYYKTVSGEFIPTVHPENKGWLTQRGCFKTASAISVWKYCFLSDLINRYKLRFPHYRIGEDATFLCSYLMIIKSGYALDKKLYVYYVQKGSLTDSPLIYKSRWLHRFELLPKLLWGTFQFAVKNKKLLKELYMFYWFFVWLQSRIGR